MSKQGDLAAQRDMALLCLGFSGGFRRSELAALKAEDLQGKARRCHTVATLKNRSDR
jgi:integrase